MLRASFPRADLLELEYAGPDTRVQGRPLEALGIGQSGGIDRRQAPGEAAQIAHLPLDALAAQILEQVVVEVDTVERRVGRMDFVEIRQVFVDEVRQWFG